MWEEGGYVFTTLTGRPINTNTDFHEWKELLRVAGVRDGRLHGARHAAATLLLILAVVDRTTQGLMGWRDSTMPARYQHLVKRVQTDVDRRQEALVWSAQTPAIEMANVSEIPEG